MTASTSKASSCLSWKKMKNLCRLLALTVSVSTPSAAAATATTTVTSTATATATITTTCDESKCRTPDPNSSPGYWWLPPVTEAGGYTCWSSLSQQQQEQESDRYPCQGDDYIGRPVVPRVTKKVEEDAGAGGSILEWYTCCYNSTSSITSDLTTNTTNTTTSTNSTTTTMMTTTTTVKNDNVIGGDVEEQTCSDSHCDPDTTFSCWSVPDGLAPQKCTDVNGVYIYPRLTGAVVPMNHGDMIYNIQQFLCCKEEEEKEIVSPTNEGKEEEEDDDDTNSNSIDPDGDRLPDACSISSCTSLNGVGGGDCWADGITEPFTCDINSPYKYPTRNGHDDLNLFNFHYVCCTTPNYYVNVMGTVKKWDGLRIALVIQSILSMISFIVCSIFTMAILSNRKCREQAWNVYLVLLAIPDVLYNFVRFVYGIIVVTHSNTFIQTTWTFDWFYAVANLLLNCVVVYEVHKFLRAFQTMSRKIPAPSFRTVLIQAMIVYTLAAGCGTWMHFLHVQGNTLTNWDHDRFLKMFKISLCAMVIPPILFVIFLYLDVWYRNLLPDASGERTRTLALYFLRVILVFLLTWLPYMILITFGLRSNRLLGYIGMALSSLQGTISVMVALSKLDIQWAIICFVKGQWNADPPRVINNNHHNSSSNDNHSKSFPNTTSKRNMGSIRISGINFSSMEQDASKALRSSTFVQNMSVSMDDDDDDDQEQEGSSRSFPQELSFVPLSSKRKNPVLVTRLDPLDEQRSDLEQPPSPATATEETLLDSTTTNTPLEQEEVVRSGVDEEQKEQQEEGKQQHQQL